ncbi:hypothetical protein G436_0511 [Leptospira interrogans serovar Hardjo str. Norma]|uniref:Uncharacterized protein n=1 Tax=Leptospira interrogans serovar Hardjo str. Norma TaxID=1279460 RepID=A0A0M4NGR7_LEPIR|nr:hypothetical protein G436_0511 [Leptospira interrogans serovar Hardjo str. Norma]
MKNSMIEIRKTVPIIYFNGNRWRIHFSTILMMVFQNCIWLLQNQIP